MHHGSQDVAGGNTVDSDLVGAPLHGEVARQLNDGGFGSVVGRADEILMSVKLA